jgi:hypothetical protein
MADDTQHTPPYLAWATFDNITEELRGKGLPRKLDRSVLKGKSGSTQAQYLAALRFMGMIDSEDRPTEFFKSYVETPDMRPQIMREIVQDKYGPILALGTDSTTAELTEKFRGYSLSGETGRKAISFFLNAARFAGIPVSSHWPQTRPGVGGGRARANGTTAPRRRATRRKPAEPEARLPIREPPDDAKGRYIDLLLKKAEADDALDTDLLDRIERVIGIENSNSKRSKPRATRKPEPAGATTADEVWSDNDD